MFHHVKQTLKRVVSRVIQNKTVYASGMTITGSFCDYGILKAMSKGDFEPFFISLFTEAISGSHRFADVGAHLGFYSIYAAKKMNARGIVDAFEPHPRNGKYLQLNISRNSVNKRIRTHTAAVSDSVGETVFYADQLQSDFSSMSPTLGSQYVQAITVPMTTLDAIYAVGETFSCLKVDVEGHEAKVLRGARAAITRSLAEEPIFHLFIECNPSALAACGSSASEIFHLIREMGLKISIIEESTRQLVAVDDKVPVNTCNLLCTKA